MNKQETIDLLREWGTGDFSRLLNKNSGICLNLYRDCYIFESFLLDRGMKSDFPLGVIRYHIDMMLGRLWKNPKRLQLCLDFADWLEERE